MKGKIQAYTRRWHPKVRQRYTGFPPSLPPPDAAGSNNRFTGTSCSYWEGGWEAMWNCSTTNSKQLANQWRQSRQQGLSSRHISVGYLLDSLKCSDLQREETPRNKEMETRHMRGGCELHGREENRSEVCEEERAPWALTQTPFLPFLPLLNNLTVHTNSHLVLSNLPHHENNTKILFVGQHKGQKQRPEQLADLAETLQCCVTC